MKALQKQLFIFLHLTRHIHLCKKIKRFFCSAFMLFGPCQFLHYAKFMHFGALQHFSLLDLNWNISYFIFLH